MTLCEKKLCRREHFSGSPFRNASAFLFTFLILSTMTAYLAFCGETAPSISSAYGGNAGPLTLSDVCSMQEADGPGTALPALRTNPFSLLQQTMRSARTPLLSALQKLQTLLVFALAAVSLLLVQRRIHRNSSFRNYIFLIVLKASLPVRAGPVLL